MAEDKVLQIIGAPVRNPIVSIDPTLGDEEHNAPQYLVYPVQWHNVGKEYLTEQPCIVDFGESFDMVEPPQDLSTPGPYRSPELILDCAAGIGSDLWALGCTLFEIRTGRKLFGTFYDDDNSYLVAMVQVLGPFPEPWWSTTWTKRRRMYRDKPDTNGLVIAAVEPKERKHPGASIRHHPSVAHGARSLQGKLAPGLWYLDGQPQDRSYHQPISPEEIELFAGFLSKLLEYTPSKRIAAADLLSHEWFSL